MDALKRMAQLRKLMRSIELELGIGDFNECEKDIISIFADLEVDEIFTSQIFDREEFMSRHSRPTIFRAISRLIDRGMIERAGKERSGLYRIIREI
jgi:predicted HTH transcriptional regulator